MKAGFETLVEAGYAPEMAYFECLHELKLIVDLIYEGGLSYMRYSVSDTAEFGDYHAGSKVIDEGVRERMRDLLTAVQDGSFATLWMREWAEGAGELHRIREEQRGHQIEKVGAQLRAAMPFLEPAALPPQAAAPSEQPDSDDSPEEGVPFF